MATQSGNTGMTTASTLSHGLLKGMSRLGGTVRPRTGADFTCPTDDAPELMVVTRDFLYGMDIAKEATGTCAFPLLVESDEMQLGTTVDEDTMIRLARHLLFACGNMREEAFKHVVLFILGAFGRHCRKSKCTRYAAKECALCGVDGDYDCTKALEYVDKVLELKTPIAVWAKIVVDMRSEAISSGRLSVFEHVTDKHAALLASLVYPATYPQSIKAKCFKLFADYIGEDNKFFATTQPNIASILRTFDGQTKVRFAARASPR